MTTLEILRAARALIAQPGRHCAGASARNAAGEDVPILSPDACSYCSYSAIYLVDQDGFDDASEELRKTAIDEHGVGASIINDTTDLPTVLAMFDATIARLEEQG